jgi:hypothetical protein
VKDPPLGGREKGLRRSGGGVAHFQNYIVVWFSLGETEVLIAQLLASFTGSWDHNRRGRWERHSGGPDVIHEAAQVRNRQGRLLVLPGADGDLHRLKIEKEERPFNGGVHAEPRRAVVIVERHTGSSDAEELMAILWGSGQEC